MTIVDCGLLHGRTKEPVRLIADWRLRIGDCGLAIADWRLPIADRRSRIVDAVSRISNLKSQISNPLQPTACSLQPLLPFLLLLALTACQTGRHEAKTPASAAAPVEFQPAAYTAPIQLERGRYTDLFAPDSYGVWLGSEVTAQREIQAKAEGETVDPKLAAAVNRLTQNFLVFECHLSSAFADMSIAYDVVGLRNMAVYLMTPVGGRCMPAQIVVGSSAREERQQALRKYSRTCLILFAKRDLFSGAPAVAPQSTSVRLVIEGFGSMFVMEWPTASAAVPFVGGEDASKALHTKFKEMGSLVMRISHIFD